MATLAEISSASQGFAAWLAREKVSLAFTSYQTGLLCFVGLLPSGGISISRESFEHATGLAAQDGRLFVATKTAIWRLDNALPKGAIANHCIDALYIAREGRVTGDLDVHEVAVDGLGRPVFVATKFSCVAGLTERGFAPLWRPNFVSKIAPEDRCHLNGVAMSLGVPMYATMAARCDVAGGWYAKREGRGLVVSILDDKVRFDGLTMPHSPRYHDDALWFLDSGAGYLRRGHERVAFLPGFARGLDFVGRFALVTISLPRGQDFAGLPLEAELKRRGAEPWCGVLVIDIQSGDIVEWVRFAKPVTELFAVVALPGVRCPAALAPTNPEIGAWFEYDESQSVERSLASVR